jgi:decaprenylphospho-beta-D-erythro-pentofuranosid-2-ulose 2-reductase
VSEPATRVALLGGTSEIGLAIVRRLAADAHEELKVALVGRDAEGLQRAADELHAGGGIRVSTVLADLGDPAEHAGAIRHAAEALDGIELVVLAVGMLGGQQGIAADPAQAVEVMRVSFVACGSLLHAALRELYGQSHGTVVVLSSVAGVRVRASNPFYGAAKAGLDGLAAALGDAARARGVRTLIVRPGFVVGRMTAGLPRPPLATTPEAVAEATARGLAAEREVVWVPAAIGLVFSILRLLPRAVWRRLPL